ncbi:MAG: hypothetical protein COY40_01645 [Alphaproteobacteria bacterium CG_4_10_14_0_8_um_filter_53_9]|nr:MAG: hypothetical protein COY40_01645 [Alphaproteobacteria bacterium CG_4_10_14_0_8_um_filter_53_9]
MFRHVFFLIAMLFGMATGTYAASHGGDINGTMPNESFPTYIQHMLADAFPSLVPHPAPPASMHGDHPALTVARSAVISAARVYQDDPRVGSLLAIVQEHRMMDRAPLPAAGTPEMNSLHLMDEATVALAQWVVWLGRGTPASETMMYHLKAAYTVNPSDGATCGSEGILAATFGQTVLHNTAHTPRMPSLVSLFAMLLAAVAAGLTVRVLHRALYRARSVGHYAG